MPKLEELLKAQGYTDADIAAAGTLISDSKFRGAVETYVDGLQTQLTGFQTENNNWADWAEKTHKPLVENLQREKVELASQVGSLDARVRALDPNYKPGEPQNRQAPPAGGTPPAEFDPAKHGLLTRKDFDTEVAKYAAGQGMAIAMSNDLAAEYKRLTGQDMLDYQATDSEGRHMSGMSALLYEARTNNKLLPDYIAQKFDFAGKRAAAAQTQKQAAEDAIRKDERTKVISEFGNPNTRPGVTSNSPFIPPPRTAEGAGKMPWEVPAAERRNARITRALETQARSTVN